MKKSDQLFLALHFIGSLLLIFKIANLKEYLKQTLKHLHQPPTIPHPCSARNGYYYLSTLLTSEGWKTFASL